ncbi:MAG: glycosyltransferase family 2 protein [Planctomycetota bacterium]|nr:glycosyltransferase family 2 protein [Planctomycetota bacterium]
MSRRYVLITPCRDEGEHLPVTIESVARQTILPARWVIVDDGSKDNTAEVLADAAARHAFIRIVTRADRGGRAVGPGVIEAFYAGLETIDLDEYEYLCKLDGDLDLPADYFQRVMEHFEHDAYLGNFSGKSYVRENGRLVSERLGDENAIGAAKFYRVPCFRDIGGFVRQVSWDGIDGHMCRLRGWIAQSEDDEALRFVHLRRMGSSQRSLWAGRKRWGRGKYFMGSTLPYVAAVSLYRMFERPYIVGGIGILLGYVRAMLGREERFSDPEYLRFFRRFERCALLHGKAYAIGKFNGEVRARFAPPAERPVGETTNDEPARREAA